MNSPPPRDRWLCWSAGLLLAAGAGLLLWRWRTAGAQYLLKPALVMAALAIAFVAGGLWLRGWPQRWLRAAAILLLNTVLILGLAELACRALHLDFNKLLRVREQQARVPLFYRLPDKPVGDVYFVRSGPDAWSGRVLNTMLACLRCTDNPYPDEREITVRYDRDGFRNPEDLRDWDFVIAGDSFTESGYLPIDSIFPTLTAQALHRRVKQLGASDTGNFSHSYYLKAYGRAPSCKAAVLAFFEGNDIEDDVHELADLRRHAATGARPSHDVPAEPSLLRMMYRLAVAKRDLRFGRSSFANATFTGGGARIPVTIADAPPAPDTLTGAEREGLTEGLKAWAAACAECRVEPWLLYIPCKRRVYHGHLEQGRGYPEPGWQDNALPAYVARLCGGLGIRIVDGTPALRAKATVGVETFNAIYDTHLNAEGHRVIATVLADALAPGPSH